MGRPGYPPTEKEVNKFLEEQEKHPPTGAEQSLVRLFSELPSWVQEYYAMAKVAAGDFILCVLKNLDQNENTYLQGCGNKLNTYFNAQL